MSNIAPPSGKKTNEFLPSPVILQPDIRPHKTNSAFLFANENTTVVHILWLQIIKCTHLFFNVILWKRFAVKAPQMGLLGRKVPLSSKRSPKLSGPVTERLGRVVVVVFVGFFFLPKSRDLSWRSGAQKLARTQTHTPPESQLRPGGSALQTVLCRFATRRLHWSRWEMSVGGKREHYSFIFFFSLFPVCPHFPSQPVMLYESLTHLAATN